MTLALLNKDGWVVDLAPERFDVADSMRWVECPEDTQCGSQYVGGTFVAPIPPAAVVDVKGQALAALQASDVTMLRCWETGQSPPAEWVAYRAALRLVVGGASTTMPDRPATPAAEG